MFYALGQAKYVKQAGKSSAINKFHAPVSGFTFSGGIVGYRFMLSFAGCMQPAAFYGITLFQDFFNGQGPFLAQLQIEFFISVRIRMTDDVYTDIAVPA